MLRQLIEGAIKLGSRSRLVQALPFSLMLQEVVDRYNKQATSAAKIIEELIELAKTINAAKERGYVWTPESGTCRSNRGIRPLRRLT